MTDDVEQKAKPWSMRMLGLSETLLLAAIPALAYLLTFAYKTGYLSFFHMPSDYITFSLAEILVASAVLIAFLAGALVVSSLVVAVWEMLPGLFRTGPIGHRLHRLVFIALAYGAIYVLFPNLRSPYFVLFGLLFLVLMVAVEFLLPLWRNRGVGNYLDKLKAADAAVQRADADVDLLIDRLVRSIDRKLLQGLFLVVALVYITWGVGRYRAISQESFYVVNTSPETVVLQATADYMICAPFDRASQEIEPAFQILKNGEDPSIVFRLEQVGPLHLRSVPVSASPTVTPSPVVP